MSDRRQFGRTILAASAWLIGSPLSRAWAASEGQGPHLGDDGLYRQPWFIETFLNLPEDLQEATSQRKRLAIIWEQRGCPYCKELHLVNFARPEISEYIKKHFAVLQLNLWGAREVTDFDGEALTERELSFKWRVNFTPTIQFFPPAVPADVRQPGVELEVARMPGYFKPFHFITMFEFVHERAYERLRFQRYLREKVAALQAKGIKPEVW
ncbi:MAG: thioredoxin family protein [Acidiferrobacterales bacterium]|nr:thioredoxin family protein [Acidiferrobacterales bacterium]